MCASLRAVAVVPAMADAASDEFGCPQVSSAGGSNPSPIRAMTSLNIYQGATPDTLPNRTRTLIAAIRAANSSISNADLTNALVAAYCPVVAQESGVSLATKRATLANFIAGAQPLVEAKAN